MEIISFYNFVVVIQSCTYKANKIIKLLLKLLKKIKSILSAFHILYFLNLKSLWIKLKKGNCVLLFLLVVVSQFL